MKTRATLLAHVTLILPFFLLQGGCSNMLAFGTATKFGLDIAQQADKTIDVTLGYDRAEIVSIPAAKETDASACSADKISTDSCNNDAYSVLGTFSINYGNPWYLEPEPLELNQFFSTGIAARQAAKIGAFNNFFGTKSGDIAKETGKKTSGTKQ